jgi:catalase
VAASRGGPDVARDPRGFAMKYYTEDDEELYKGLGASETSGNYPQVPREVDDFKQAGDLYRLQPKDAQQRLVDNIVGSLGQVSRDDIIERSIAHFRKADAEFGYRLSEGIAKLRGAALATQP